MSKDSPRDREGKVTEFQRSQSFDHFTAVSGVGSSPALATCETSQVLLAVVSGGFPRVLLFWPTYRLACLDMSEIILEGMLNRIDKIIANHTIQVQADQDLQCLLICLLLFEILLY